MIHRSWSCKWNELTCQRLVRWEALEKDYKGFHAFEQRLPFYQEARRQKFYIHETVRHIEHRASHLAREGEKTKELLRRQKTWHRHAADRLLNIDYELLLYKRLYEGDLPYVLMSPRQMEAWIRKEKEYNLQLVHLIESGGGPLQSLYFLEQVLKPKLFKKWIKPYQLPQKKKADKLDLLSVIPYGFADKRDSREL